VTEPPSPRAAAHRVAEQNRPSEQPAPGAGGVHPALHPAGPAAAALVDLDPDTGLIVVIRMVGNPDKLTGLGELPR